MVLAEGTGPDFYQNLLFSRIAAPDTDLADFILL